MTCFSFVISQCGIYISSLCMGVHWQCIELLSEVASLRTVERLFRVINFEWLKHRISFHFVFSLTSVNCCYLDIKNFTFNDSFRLLQLVIIHIKLSAAVTVFQACFIELERNIVWEVLVWVVLNISYNKGRILSFLGLLYLHSRSFKNTLKLVCK